MTDSWRRNTKDAESEKIMNIQAERNLTVDYLFYLLSIRVALLSVRMMLQELRYICHDGFLIWFVYIDIWGGKQISVIHTMTRWLRIQNMLDYKNWHFISKRPSVQQCFVWMFHQAESDGLMELNYADVKPDLSGFTVKGRHEGSQMACASKTEVHIWAVIDGHSCFLVFLKT